jgi:Flp pilus assembly pilin Flp
VMQTNHQHEGSAATPVRTMYRSPDSSGRAARRRVERSKRVPMNFTPRIPVVTSTRSSRDLCTELSAHQCMRTDRVEGGDFYMTFSDLRAYLNARFAVEEGQTMAEYGVVLAVIAVGTVAAFTALKTGIAGAINNVVGNL